jgi:threonine dehydratase
MTHRIAFRQKPKAHPRPFITHEMLGPLRVPAFEDVVDAASAIGRHVRRTPVLRSPRLDEVAGGRVWLKAENLQVTGSFKARGAFNALLRLSEEQRARGVVAYSTGNHGQAIAWAARSLGMRATIVMPHDAPENKVARALRQGARVVRYDRRHESREAIGMRLLKETGGTLIPPGDHPDVLAAQGTAALEAWQDLPPGAQANLHSFLTPCGGGGLAAGCALVMASCSAATRMVAVEPASFDDTLRSLETGRREHNQPDAVTVCDALQAATPAELPFEINASLLDAVASVSEAEVAAAVRFAVEELRMVVEPGGAVALAALLAGRIALDGRDAIAVLSGGNIDSALLAGFITDI